MQLRFLLAKCTLSSENFTRMREYVGEKLGNTVLSICQWINKSQYMPSTPTRDGLCDIFDDRYADCEPYLYHIDSNLSEFFFCYLKAMQIECAQLTIFLAAKRADPNTRSGFMLKLFKDFSKFGSS